MKIFKFIYLPFFMIFASQLLAEQIRLSGDFERYDSMGYDVQIEGDFALVSAPLGTGATVDSGLVNFYQKLNNDWVLKDTIFPLTGSVGDRFGHNISLNGSRLAVSAIGNDILVNGGLDSIGNAGSVYIYELHDGVWQQTAHILGEEQNGLLGFNMSLDEDRLIISSRFESGAVYVYDLIDGQWIETAKITDLSDQGESVFGAFDIILEEDLAFISMQINRGEEDITGQINVYKKINEEWIKQNEITPVENVTNDFFGSSFDYYSGRLVIGVSGVENDEGAVYVYESDGLNWVLGSTISLPANIHDRFFGYSLALSEDQLLVGAFDDDLIPLLGVVHVFNYINSEWEYVTQIVAEDTTADNPGSDNFFGHSMSVDFDQVLIGSYTFDQSKGAAYISKIEPNSQRLSINAGLNGIWFNQETAGQGLFLDVNASTDFSFLGWFTYDTAFSGDDEIGQIGADGQRWLVGTGDIDQSNSSIQYNLYYAYDGLFDDPRAVQLSSLETYGSLTMEFQSCLTALVSYELFESNISGSYPVSRPVAGSGTLCEDLDPANSGSTQLDNEFDYSLNGLWFNPETSGQGIFIDKFKGVEAAFMGWFTFDSILPTNSVMSDVGAIGQRWLVGQGSVDATNPNVLNYQLYYTYGGLFDDPVDVTVVEPGSYGDLRIEFTDCANATVQYSISAEGLSGSYPMVRGVPNGCDSGAE